jgi:hypothetical protein
MATLEVNFNKTLGTKTILIEEKSSSVANNTINNVIKVSWHVVLWHI